MEKLSLQSRVENSGRAWEVLLEFFFSENASGTKGLTGRIFWLYLASRKREVLISGRIETDSGTSQKA